MVFLITSIIINEMSLKKFSLINFYERRIRRLFPALIFVIFVTCFLFEMIFGDRNKKIISFQSFPLFYFMPNFFFQDIGSYFSPLNEKQPLLHTWSLSIEEQFYLVFPIFWFFFLRKLTLFLF